MQASSKVGGHMVDLIVNPDLTAVDVFDLLRHDYKTFTHAFNTATFILFLAKGLGVSRESELKEMATGALLHDIGKLSIPTTILNKRGRPSPKERRVIERHPSLGFKALCLRQDISWGQLMMVYQHHERVDGGGYPVGHTRDKIHNFARLCAVVDVFEAMTSYRPYREALPVAHVLEYLDDLAGAALDEEIVRCWNDLIMKHH
jgi:HD-GYP domain-containing protein (c-di-GMP phosphodiesterase class II)